MINILIPMGGKSGFFDAEEYPFPKPLVEIKGKAMIELALHGYMKMKRDKKFIFVINEEDSSKYYIDDILKLVTDKNCEIVQLRGETKGAACSCLISIDHINNDSPLIIANADQVIDIDFDKIISKFEHREVDGGVICFESVHPKWSYVRLDDKGKIIETAEKRPISKKAIAGFYYFRKGSDFVRATMASIEKDAHVRGLFYIAPIYNELVLEGKNLEIIEIKSEEYHSFYSPQKIKEYEQFL